jgi:hypothetical protein
MSPLQSVFCEWKVNGFSDVKLAAWNGLSEEEKRAKLGEYALTLALEWIPGTVYNNAGRTQPTTDPERNAWASAKRLLEQHYVSYRLKNDKIYRYY